MTRVNADRDRYVELRHKGVEQWEAFRQAGGRRSADTCARWERWFRTTAGLPLRPQGRPKSQISRNLRGDW